MPIIREKGSRVQLANIEAGQEFRFSDWKTAVWVRISTVAAPSRPRATSSAGSRPYGASDPASAGRANQNGFAPAAPASTLVTPLSQRLLTRTIPRNRPHTCLDRHPSVTGSRERATFLQIQSCPYRSSNSGGWTRISIED